MDDLHRCFEKCTDFNMEFTGPFDEGSEQFKIGKLLRSAREGAGFTQEELAVKLNTKKSAISRLENHSEDVKLSTLFHYAEALGKKLQVVIQ
jgi:HTH-type transcriptional regulator/antitoxin HipB